jgi:hypothetical protein
VYKLRSSSLCSVLQPPATSSLLGPNILLSPDYRLAQCIMNRIISFNIYHRIPIYNLDS